MARRRRGANEQRGRGTSGSGPLNHQSSAFRGEFGDIWLYSPRVSSPRRLCAPPRARSLLPERSCNRDGLQECHESGFPQPSVGCEGGEDWGKGQWKISIGSGRAERTRRQRDLEVVMGRARIDLHISGTQRRALRSLPASWVQISRWWSSPSSKHVTSPLPRPWASVPISCALLWIHTKEKKNISCFHLCTRSACAFARVCWRVCAWIAMGERTCCSIHQNTRIVFSHGRAAGRACSRGHGILLKAPSAPGSIQIDAYLRVLRAPLWGAGWAG